MLIGEGKLMKLTFAVLYIAVVWLCLEAVRIPDLRDLIKQGYESTMRLSTMVVFILIGSTCFSVVFLGVSGGVWLEHHLTSIPGGVWGFLIFINLFIFFLAFFLDFFEIAFIILPMVAPIAQKVLAPVVGPDAALIWFGVMLCVNMQTSFLHPPFGFALFYLRGVAPKEVKSSDIYWGALPWIGLQAIMVAIVIAFPISVTGLLDKPLDVDLSKVKIEVPQIELPPLDFGGPEAVAALRATASSNEKPRIAPGFLLVEAAARRRSALRVTRHEVVVADFGDLEPLVAGARERRQQFMELLEVRIGGRDFVVQFPCRLEARFHDLR